MSALGGSSDSGECNQGCQEAGGVVPEGDVSAACLVRSFQSQSCQALVECVQDDQDDPGSGGETPTAPETDAPPSGGGGDCAAACERLVGCELAMAETCSTACSAFPAATLSCVARSGDCQAAVACFQ